MLATFEGQQAAYAINRVTRCGLEAAENFVLTAGISEPDLLWLSEVLSMLPVPERSIKRKPVVGVCAHCGCEFDYEWTTRPRQYCSRSCEGKAYRARVKAKNSTRGKSRKSPRGKSGKSPSH